MKKHYDFSKGERGKFYSEDMELCIPVYLDKEIQDFIENLSRKTRKTPGVLVNELLKNDMRIIDLGVRG